LLSYYKSTNTDSEYSAGQRETAGGEQVAEERERERERDREDPRESQHSYGPVTVNKEMPIEVDHPYANVDMTAMRSTALTEIVEPVAVQDSIDSSSINLVLFKRIRN
jgi:hypothetical protein